MKAKTFFVAALVFALGAAGTAAHDAFHFALSKSMPAADASVASPEQVQLWFTQQPQDNSVGIRLINGAGDAVATSEPVAHPDDAMSYLVTPASPLRAGSYTVSWRGIGDDGHIVRGDFAFSVSAQE